MLGSVIAYYCIIWCESSINLYYSKRIPISLFLIPCPFFFRLPWEEKSLSFILQPSNWSLTQQIRNRESFRDYLSTPLEHITVAIVIIARCAWFGEHIGNIIWSTVPLVRWSGKKLYLNSEKIWKITKRHDLLSKIYFQTVNKKRWKVRFVAFLHTFSTVTLYHSWIDNKKKCSPSLLKEIQQVLRTFRFWTCLLPKGY